MIVLVGAMGFLSQDDDPECFLIVRVGAMGFLTQDDDPECSCSVPAGGGGSIDPGDHSQLRNADAEVFKLQMQRLRFCGGG